MCWFGVLVKLWKVLFGLVCFGVLVCVFVSRLVSRVCVWLVGEVLKFLVSMIGMFFGKVFSWFRIFFVFLLCVFLFWL